MNKNKKLGFTLAEVLIVIGIIGVVAALTLPNLNHATGDKEKVTKVKKIYSTLNAAFDRAQVIYGNSDTWENGLSTNAEINERFAKRVTEFIKVSKDCGNEEGCWSFAPLLDSQGNVLEDNYYVALSNNCGSYFVSLSDGVSLAFKISNGSILVDIDGPNKGKTQVGNDIFDFTVYTNDGKTEPMLIPSARPDEWTGTISESYAGNYATAWVIENGNLDYLKCPEELDWETKTSCE